MTANHALGKTRLKYKFKYFFIDCNKLAFCFFNIFICDFVQALNIFYLYLIQLETIIYGFLHVDNRHMKLVIM